ncbi:MAG: hypothetical protein JWL79_2367 [Frankiales bacterium]|nr:hypothetical protein [Frankiales bacterium]
MKRKNHKQRGACGPDDESHQETTHAISPERALDAKRHKDDTDQGGHYDDCRRVPWRRRAIVTRRSPGSATYLTR